MNEHDHDAWDDGVRGLLLREARLERVPADARRRLQRRLGLSVLASALTGTTAAAGSGTRLFGTLLAKKTAGVILSMAVGASTGGAVLYVAETNSASFFGAKPSPAAPEPASPLRDHAAPASAPSVFEGRAMVEPAPELPVPDPAMPKRRSSPAGERESATARGPAETIAGSPEPQGAEHDVDLTRERELLESARGDLTARRFEEALRKIERHMREYRTGQLAPEREALAVQALVGAGRYDEARRRGADFAARFPRSMFRTVVDSTLATIK